MTALIELRDMLAKVDGPRRELDAIIFWIFADHSEDDHGLTGDPIQVMTKLWGGSPALWSCIPQVTSSIDAALALVERLLPECDAALYLQTCLRYRWCCQIEPCPKHEPQYEGNAPTAPLAILEALVAALIEKEYLDA